MIITEIIRFWLHPFTQKTQARPGNSCHGTLKYASSCSQSMQAKFDAYVIPSRHLGILEHAWQCEYLQMEQFSSLYLRRQIHRSVSIEKLPGSNGMLLF